jgi:WD40 repeat protein
MSSCPAPERLEQLLEEQLQDADQRAVSRHVADCRRCQATLERLTEGEPSVGKLSASLRGQAASETAASKVSTGTFLAQLKQLSPLATAAPQGAPGRTGPHPPGPPSARPRFPQVAGYEILKELGRGGMGVIYQARHLGLGRLVALKMILAGGHAASKELARFRQEAEAVARLRHPNIVQIYDIGETESRPYFALEYVEEGSLVQRLRGDPQPLAPAVRLVETLAQAIHYAHQHGIVHRDLKPANILLDQTVPKITDFGLARRLDKKASGPHSSEVVGTPSYMAPEQAAGKSQAAGPAADVYALGAILYEMLTGRPPFKGATPVDTVVQVIHEEPLRPGRLRPKLPRDLETICLKCLEKDPRKRYASAEALADDLRRFRQGKPILARPVGLLERTWKRARRRPLTAALLLALVLSAILGFTGVTWQWQVALAEKADADMARIEAETARQRAARARERARRALYFSRITQTQLQWQANDLAGALRNLAKCRPAAGQQNRRGWEWYHLQGLFHADLLTFHHSHGGLGSSVVYYPGGKRIASVVGGFPATEADKPGEVLIWDVARDRLVKSLRGPGTLHRLAVRPDGRRLALGTTNGTVLVWGARTGREYWRRPLHTAPVAGLAYSPDGRRIATAGWDHAVKILSGKTGVVRHHLTGHARKVQAVAFNPRGDRLASGDWAGVIKFWDARGHLLHTEQRHKSAVYCLSFSHDGQFLVSADSEGHIRIWEVATGKVTQRLTGHAGAVLSVAFSPDDRYLAYGGGDSTVRIWDVEAGVERITFRGHTAAVEGIAFSPDGQRLASVSPSRGMVKVWDLTRHPEYATFARTGKDIEAFAFQESGKRLVSVTVGGKLQVWDVATGVLQDERFLPLTGKLVSPAVVAAFAPGGRRLAARSRKDPRLVKVWDVATGARRVVFRGHTLPVTCVRYSADGRWLVSGGHDPKRPGQPQEIKVWEAATGKLLATRTGRGPVYTVVFSPDGRSLALGSKNGLAFFPDWAATPQRWWFGGHQGEVAAIAFRQDGRLLVSAGLMDRQLRIWDLRAPGGDRAARRPILRPLAAPRFLCDLAFSPDGRRLAGASRDLVRLWDLEAGQEVITLRGAPQRHWDPPFNPRVAFSPDGRLLAGTNWDESISLWDAEERTDRRQLARSQAARRRAADRRAVFWHLQEAELCLRHKNLSAAVFHFQRLGQVPLPGPLQTRKERLGQLLALSFKGKGER